MSEETKKRKKDFYPHFDQFKILKEERERERVESNLANGGESSGFFFDPTQLSLDPFTNFHPPLVNLILFSFKRRERRTSHLLVFFRHMAAEAQASSMQNHLVALRRLRRGGGSSSSSGVGLSHLRFLLVVFAALLPQTKARTRVLGGVTVGFFE